MDSINICPNPDQRRPNARLAALRDFIYQEEELRPAAKRQDPNLPPMLKQARLLEEEGDSLSRRAIFLKQARLLANYEDDFVYAGDTIRYYPTYQSLRDDELRGYFSWRTKFRQIGFQPAPLPFIYLHIYELLNNAICANPLTGYEQLLKIRHAFGEDDPRLSWQLDAWLHDYVIYYDLDKSLLDETADIARDKCITVLANLENESDDSILDAVKYAAPKWLNRSKFYAEHFEDMDQIIPGVFRRMDAHYAKSCKRGLVEQIFGLPNRMPYNMFSAAVFCDPLNRSDYTYRLSSEHAYRCEDGLWSCETRVASRKSERRLDKILKTIDATMREEWSYHRPINSELSTRWLLKAIHEELAELAAAKAKAAKPKLELDFASLAKIRSDAASTQEKLIVAEDMEEPVSDRQETIQASGSDAPELDANESRLLHCLLYGGDLDWISAQGLILSVLVDSINEKLYESFEDSVLDDSPALVEDYIENLKELVRK